MRRNIKKKEFKKIFPDCKYGKECSKKVSKFVFEYKLEKDKKNKVSYDHILFHVKGYKEPIPFSILRNFLYFFEVNWNNMYWDVNFKDNPKNGREDYIQYQEVLNDHAPVYYIDFTQLDDLRYLKYILYGTALELYK